MAQIAKSSTGGDNTVGDNKVGSKGKAGTTHKAIIKLDSKGMIRYIIVAIAIVILCFGRFFGLYPFGTAAMIGLDYYSLVIAPIYLVAQLVVSSDTIGVVFAIVNTAIVVGTRLIRPRHSIFVRAAMLVASEVLRIQLDSGDIIQVIVCIFIVLGFGVATRQASIALDSQTKVKIAVDKLVCIGIVLCAFGLSLQSIPYRFDMLGFMFGLCILIGAYVSPIAGLIVAICMGNGAAIGSFDSTIIGLYTVIGVGLCFFGRNRLFGSLVMPIIYMAYQTIFLSYRAIDIFTLISFACASVIFLALPKGALDSLASRILVVNPKHASRQMVDNERNYIARQVNDTSRLFAHIDTIISGLGQYMQDSDINMLGASQVYDRCCANCEHSEACVPQTQRLEHIASLVRSGISKDNISLMDYPPELFEKCTRIHELTTAVYGIRQGLLITRQSKKADEFARQCVARQLGGVSRILAGLGSTIGTTSIRDERLECRIVASLAIIGIDATDIVIKSTSPLIVSMCVPQLQMIDNDRIARSVSSACKTSMLVQSVMQSMDYTYTIVNMSQVPKYDVLFATSNVAKNKVSGDTHSFVKLNQSKFMMALCDGMGSGEAAERMSSSAIALVECFYKAGFESELVLDSINKFLELSGSETYVAVDIAVIDLFDGTADIIKIGSPQSYIKESDRVQIVEGGALPMGIVLDIKPATVHKKLSSGDMIVFCTDGITDCFEEDRLAGLIGSINTVNPQTLAYSVIDTAIKINNQEIRDDMSIVVARIFDTNEI